VSLSAQPIETDVAGTLATIRQAVATVVVGAEEPLNQLLTALLCRGHVLLEDVPGTGKTLLARSLSQALGCDFHRVQLTPDVLPSDITGSNVFNQRTSEFEFRPGPIFTQLLLVDEVNRATPRTQSALLEAMEERQVTVDGETRPLPDPFLVLATQNPIEFEGTFPLPEAQLDRFMLRVSMGYPTAEAEDAILRQRTGIDDLAPPPAVVDPAGVLALQRARSAVVVSDDVRAYLIHLVRATREDERLVLGASPRASLALFRAVQARALLHARNYALPDDVKALAVPVLGHRLVPTASARLHGATAADVLAELVDALAVPVEDAADPTPPTDAERVAAHAANR
jgi:MoxR-like ATPase